MEIAATAVVQRLDHRQRRLRRRCTLATATARFSVTTGEGCIRSSAGVERVDPGPVGVLGPRGAGMQGGDGRLHLIGAGAAVAHRLVDQRQALADQLAVPERAVLVVQQHDLAVGVEPGRRRARAAAASAPSGP